MTQTAKLFTTGRSQAVRLPKEFRFDTDEVFIRKQGDDLLISAREPGWDEFFDSVSVFGDDFLPDREDDSPQEREPV